MPYLGKTPSQATRQRYYKTASGGETSISGTMTTGGTLTFNDGEFVDVKLNGVSLVAGTDYNTTTANTIGGLSALSANDQVEIVVYDTFSVFGGNVDADFTINNGTLTVGTTTIDNNGDVKLADSDVLYLGSGLDLQIQHNGSGSFITDAGTGDLHLRTDTNLNIQNAAGSESKAVFATDGAVELYHDNSKKIETTSTGVDVTGVVGGDTLNINGTGSGDIAIINTSANSGTGLYVNSQTANQIDLVGFDGSAANAVNIRSGGASGAGLNVNTSNNVGISTTSPVSKLNVDSGDFAISSTVNSDGGDLGELVFYNRTNAGSGSGTSFVNDVTGIQAKMVGTGNNSGGELSFFTKADGGDRGERMRLSETGRLEFQTVTNETSQGLQSQRLDWLNENAAGVMAGIGVVREADGNAPGAFVIRTSTNVDSSSNSGDGEISEKFRVASNGDLTATDTSIASNSDQRLKENIADYDYDLAKFKQFQTRTFNWKQPTLHGEKSGVRGFVAQELEAIDSYWVNEIEVQSDSDDYQYLPDTDIPYGPNNIYKPDDAAETDTQRVARFAKTSKLGQKDAMYVSVIQQLIAKIETLETKVAALETGE